MPAQTWKSVLNTNQAANFPAAVAYASSSTLTDVSPGAATQGLVVPANYLQVGSILKVSAAGVFSNTATPTLILGVYWGGVAGVAFAATGAITTITGATNWPFLVEWEGVVRSIGTGGSIMGSGVVKMPASATQFQAEYNIPTTGTVTPVTIDTTTAKLLSLGATWGTLSASNTLTVTRFEISSEA